MKGGDNRNVIVLSFTWLNRRINNVPGSIKDSIIQPQLLETITRVRFIRIWVPDSWFDSDQWNELD